jgi:uncharacterized iron-regulated membrane protein
MQEHSFRSTPPSENALRMPLDSLLSGAASAKGKLPSAITIWSDKGAPVEVEFGRDDRALFDSYNGALLGSGAVRTRKFFDTVTSLHRWFGASVERKPLARAIKGAFDLALLLMTITGLILWCPKTWSWSRFKAGALLRFGLTGRAHDWNRHNAIGFWVALPLVIIVITGAILSYSWATNLLYLVAGSPPPTRTVIEKTEKHGKHHKDHQQTITEVSIDQIFKDAQSRSSGWRSLRATLPQSGEKTITVAVDFADGSRPDQKAEVVYDRSSGAMLQLKAFSSYNLGTRLHLFVHMVHTGEAGGILGQTVIGLASLSCCVLVWTGFLLVIRRI